MTKFERMIQDLTGRKATPRDLETLRRIKDTMGVSDNDAVWWVIILLQTQVVSVAELVQRVEHSAKRYENAIRDAGTKAEKIMKEARSESGRAKTDQNAGNSKDVRTFHGVVFLVILLVCVYWSHGFGEDKAIAKVCEYNPELAATLFDDSECEKQ